MKIGKLLPACAVAVIFSSCAKPTPVAQPFEIENLNSGFAFKGKISGKYYLEDDHLRVDVSEWQIGFGANDQEGGQLDRVYFELVVDKAEGYFTHQAISGKTPVNRYVGRSERITLTNLKFTIPRNKVPNIKRTWLVAVYENDRAGGGTGHCYAHDSKYLFTEKKNGR